jgi:hypothetical protein
MHSVLRQRPLSVWCTGLAHLQRRLENVAYMTMFFGDSLDCARSRELAVAGEAAATGFRHISEAIRVNGGTSALHLSLLAHPVTGRIRRFAEWFRQTAAPDSRV